MLGQFRYSVIVPVYNAERFVGEAIESLVDQTIGFEDTIQLILVNDGSTDGSALVCKQYQERYPRNVVFIDMEHGGVGAARNAGLQYATGEFVNFLDSDDKWSLDAFELVDRFFRDNPRVKIAACRILQFGAWKGPHDLDYKFKETKVVNIFRNWNYPQLSVSTAFVRRDLLSGVRFSSLRTSEDFAVINSLILKEGVYGVIREAVYHVRRRFDGSSALESSSSRDYYFEPLKHSHGRLFCRSREMYGYVVPFIQYAVMYDIQWRMKDVKSREFLSSEDFEEYRLAIRNLLASISDSAIWAQKHMDRYFKVYVMGLKRNLSYSEIQGSLELDGKRYNLLGDRFSRPKDENALLLELIESEGDMLRFRGRLFTIAPEAEVRVSARYQGEDHIATLHLRDDLRQSSFFGDDVCGPLGFDVSVPVGSGGKLQFFISLFGEMKRATLRFGQFVPLTRVVPSGAFALVGDTLVSTTKNQGLSIVPNPSKRQILKKDLAFLKQVASVDGLRKALSLLPAHLGELLHRFIFPHERVWLISDRISKADDNGEHLFRAICEETPENTKAFFVLSMESEDYDRIRSMGKVVDPRSRRYRKLFLRSTMLISSSFDKHVYRLGGEDEDYFKCLLRRRFVFLQHGITKDDMSSTLNKFKKNISLFVTSSCRERDSILSLPYYYDKEEVLLCGFPRHDELLSQTGKHQRKVVILPTWRNSLVSGFDPITDEAIIDEGGFKESFYYRSWQGLLSDSRLLDCLEKSGFTVEFAMHPGFAAVSHLFVGSDRVHIVKSFNYQELLKSGSVFVTDYSSVIFDCALLKRPLAYFQFDEEEVLVRGGHIYKAGYFDYRKDGFGPVFNDIDQMVDWVIDAISPLEGACEMKNEYGSRVDEFFFNPPSGSTRSQLLIDSIEKLERR